MTKRCHQRCIAQAFGMYCKLCGAPKSGNFMETWMGLKMELA